MDIVETPKSSGESQIDSEKEALIEAKIASDKAVYDEWISNPNNKGRLDMPVEAVRYLAVPREMYAVADSVDGVQLALVNHKKDKLEVIVYERKNQPLGNREALQKLLDGEITHNEAEAQGVDPQHLNFDMELGEGTITPEDYVFTGFDLEVPSKNQILVNTYLDRKALRGKGIARGFYNNLRTIGVEGGFRFILGVNVNHETNLDFFKKKLGRVSLNQIFADKKKVFKFGETYGIPEVARTIEFLHPEDKQLYVDPTKNLPTLEELAQPKTSE